MEIIRELLGIDPRTDPNVQAFAEDFHIAQMVYDAGQAAGMTQRELADAIGVAEGVIDEPEAADCQCFAVWPTRCT